MGGISVLQTGGTDITAPVFGDGGKPFTATQTRFVNAAAESRHVMNDTLKLSSNSGAVESRQWAAMKRSVLGEY